MADRNSTVLNLRLDDTLKRAFIDAAHEAQSTAPDVLRAFMEDYVKESRRREAHRQSVLVAGSAGESEAMAFLVAAQDLDGGGPGW